MQMLYAALALAPSVSPLDQSLAYVQKTYQMVDQ